VDFSGHAHYNSYVSLGLPDYWLFNAHQDVIMKYVVIAKASAVKHINVATIFYFNALV
jgi:hypothetical protein